jgi:excisionase family DNA binding protein
MSDRFPLAESQQVAEYLGVPLRTLDMWAYRKVGPRYSKVGRHRRYRWKDVDAWLDQQAAGGPDAAA